ncbi:Hypothetical protein PFR_JS17-2_2076 [Propionibacterium freudenreichii]|nr:Hypothetical protein PFR_JS17-1_2077 [Propionibacterium freudenreichii]SCQ81360.1 Hypothetical protein PFR_JS17-2_2076 [Propionibacterium freudenreichii]
MPQPEGATVVNLISLIFGIVGTITGIGGFVVAYLSYKAAEKSNETADDAVIKAGEANQISSDANSISRRALAVTEDKSIYDWKIHLDHDARVITARNESSETARNVAVTVRDGDQTLLEEEIGDVAPFGQFTLDGSLFLNAIAASQAHIDALNNRNSGVFFAGVGTAHATFHLNWKTPAGVPRTQLVKKRFN